jgi:[acyl-carrier-protein] S-malonyltransferase
MLSSFAGDATVADVVERASAALGQDLGRLMAEGPAEELGLTVNTQPCMLTAAYAMFCAWRAAGGPLPAVVAGHSLGEYSALTAAGVFALEDAVRFVRFRAQAMQDAVPVGVGSMAAILGLDDDQVRAACAEAAQGEVVEAVNFNAPAQVVIAGHKAAVERACVAAKQRGAKRAVALPVSAPFHSSLLAPAREKLRERLAQVTLNPPQIPVIHNVDVSTSVDAVTIRDALARQTASPVRWSETIARMAADGVTHVIECGPGRVLSGLTKRIVGTLESLSISDAASLADVRAKLGG